MRFVQDDAFITYRYARNLARGEGLVFNAGEEVEGYTNFLWTLLHVVPERFGWSSPVFSQVVGIALMVATVAVTLRLARRLFGSEGFALLVALVLLGNMTFLAYATGGLETMLQTLLVLSVASLLFPAGAGDDRAWRSRRVAAGALAGLAVMTRLDSTVLVGTWLVVHLVVRWREDPPELRTRRLAAGLVQFGLPVAVLVLPWLGWKLAYYGELLPNTFHAKSAGNPIVPPLYGVIRTHHDIRLLPEIVRDHPQFVLKPAHGSGGDGIVVIAGRSGSRYHDLGNAAAVSGRCGFCGRSGQVCWVSYLCAHLSV